MSGLEAYLNSWFIVILIKYRGNLLIGSVESFNDTTYYPEGISFLSGFWAERMWPEGLEMLKTCVGYLTKLFRRENWFLK